jgi:hypothetical protein
MIEQLQKLKDSAEVKEFKDQPSGYLELGDWLLTYCIEKTFINQQKVLCISRIDQKVFNQDEIPLEVWKVFSDKWWLCFPRQFEKRGFSLMFVSVKDQ